MPEPSRYFQEHRFCIWTFGCKVASKSSWKKEIKDNENLPQTLRRLLHCSPNSGPADASSGPRSKKAFLSQAIPGFPLRIWGRAEPRWPSFFLSAQKEESFRDNTDPLSGETGKRTFHLSIGETLWVPGRALDGSFFPFLPGRSSWWWLLRTCFRDSLPSLWPGWHREGNHFLGEATSVLSLVTAAAPVWKSLDSRSKTPGI